MRYYVFIILFAAVACDAAKRKSTKEAVTVVQKQLELEKLVQEQLMDVRGDTHEGYEVHYCNVALANSLSRVASLEKKLDALQCQLEKRPEKVKRHKKK